MYGGGNNTIKTFLSSALSKQLLSLMSLEYTLEINKRACSPKCFTKYTSDFFTELRIKYNKNSYSYNKWMFSQLQEHLFEPLKAWIKEM